MPVVDGYRPVSIEMREAALPGDWAKARVNTVALTANAARFGVAAASPCPYGSITGPRLSATMRSTFFFRPVPALAAATAATATTSPSNAARPSTPLGRLRRDVAMTTSAAGQPDGVMRDTRLAISPCTYEGHMVPENAGKQPRWLPSRGKQFTRWVAQGEADQLAGWLGVHKQGLVQTVAASPGGKLGVAECLPWKLCARSSNVMALWAGRGLLCSRRFAATGSMA